MWVSLYPITSLFSSLWDTHYSFTPFGSSSALSLTSLSLITEGILSYATALCLAHCGSPVPSTLTVPPCPPVVWFAGSIIWWLHSNKWVTMTRNFKDHALPWYVSLLLSPQHTNPTHIHPRLYSTPPQVFINLFLSNQLFLANDLLHLFIVSRVSRIYYFFAHFYHIMTCSFFLFLGVFLLILVHFLAVLAPV